VGCLDEVEGEGEGGTEGVGGVSSGDENAGDEKL
jgi:hypothetical protein